MHKIMPLILLGALAYCAGLLHEEYPFASVLLLVIFVVLGLVLRYTLFRTND